MHNATKFDDDPFSYVVADLNHFGDIIGSRSLKYAQ